MSGPTAGARLGYTGKEAKEKGEELLNNFFAGFPGVKKAIDDSKEFLQKNGYVEDFIGRRRRLPDINLNSYEARPAKKETGIDPNFNPIFGCSYRQNLNDPANIWQLILDGYVVLSNAFHACLAIEDPVKNKYEPDHEMSNKSFDWLKKIAQNPAFMLSKSASEGKYARTNEAKILADMQSVAQLLTTSIYKNRRTEYNFTDNAAMQSVLNWYKEKHGLAVATFVPQEPMRLFAWTGKIAQAARQCFNARIQGSAASLTKLAMIDIFNDEILNNCQTKLIIPVHDELLVECPEEYADIVEKRLPEVMIAAAKRGGDDVPQSCDPYNVTRWYADTAGAFVQDEFKKLITGDSKKGIAPLSRDDALAKVITNHSEVPKEAIIKTIETGCDLDF